MKSIVTGYTLKNDLHTACQDLASQLTPLDSKLNLIFCSRSFDTQALEVQLRDLFGPNTLACTTAGEISGAGFSDNSLVGLAFKGSGFEIDLVSIEDLSGNSEEHLLELKKNIRDIQQRHRTAMPDGKCFGILLIDGLSSREEELASVFSDLLRGVPIIGGSAADNLKFDSTLIYHSGHFKQNSAALAFVTTTHPFEVFKVQHFCETSDRFVITSASPANRTVQEIEGVPAAKFYASRLGLDLEQLTPEVFSRNPLLLKIGDEYYVRSIQKYNPDLSLSFYCAIDNGLVLRMASPESLIKSTQTLFDNLSSKLGKNKQCLLFECVLRKLEINSLPQEDRDSIIDIYRNNNALGFHTYGEQFGGVHINQTLTGVAFSNE